MTRDGFRTVPQSFYDGCTNLHEPAVHGLLARLQKRQAREKGSIINCDRGTPEKETDAAVLTLHRPEH